jgi:D-glycero-D-manno-heptose 1,7-bisphosphate phosphatase
VTDPAVFLDRDGTLIEEVGYPARPDQIRILGGVARALARLAARGYKLVVVTNQSAIARGLLSEDDLHRFHEALDEQFDLLGAHVDAYYACPHHPDPGPGGRRDLAVDCQCRKPKPGLILGAAADMNLDLARSWLVGDTWRDIAAGQAAAVRTIKLPTIPSLDGPRPEGVQPPTAEAPDLDRACDIILSAAEAPGVVHPPPAVEAVSVPAAAGAPEPPAAPIPAAEETPRQAAPSAETAAESLPAPPAPEPPATPAPQPSAKPQKEPAAAPKAVGAARAARRTCARCGRDVTLDDIDSGAAGERDGLLLCRECIGRPPRQGQQRLPQGDADMLRSILVELRRIGRARHGGTFSLLRLLAYLIQAAALFCGLVLGVVGEEKAMFLQIAILLQLMVLTLLVLERNP